MSVKERAVMCEIPSLIPDLLAGRETQGRWIIGKPFSQPVWLEEAGVWSLYAGGIDGGHYLEADFEVIRKTLLAGCPYGQVGDRMWLREKWGVDPLGCVEYEASPANGRHYRSVDRWRSPVHMPREFSRLLQEITDIRVQRLQDISEADARAQGVREHIYPACGDHPDLVGYVTIADGEFGAAHVTPCQAYAKLWDSGIGKMEGCAWSDNPWVWALTFRKAEAAEE